MKFVCLNMWLGEMCTDDANDTNANNTNDDGDARQSMTV